MIVIINEAVGREDIRRFCWSGDGKTWKSYLGVPEETLRLLATESFLNGCRDRTAAYAASERKPERLCKAVEEMRDTATNMKAFQSRKPEYQASNICILRRWASEFQRKMEKLERPGEHLVTRTDGSGEIHDWTILQEYGRQLWSIRQHFTSGIRGLDKIAITGQGWMLQGHFVRECEQKVFMLQLWQDR